MKLDDYFADLMNTARARADVENDYTSTAYLGEMAEQLNDAEEIENLSALHFEGRGAKNRRVAVSGYDMGDSDGSVALAVLLFTDSAQPQGLTFTEAKKQFEALQNFIAEALTGDFQAGREESTNEFQLAEDLRRRGRAVTRYRLYLLTNHLLSSSAKSKDFPVDSLAGIPVEYHVWDIGRLHQLHESHRSREELVIDLTEWSPEGVPALQVSDGRGATTTYLCALPARLLADLYGRYGSRLLEGNVRSYLSARGNVNKGIKRTVMSEPDRFLAYNNGITATATDVEVNDGGQSLTAITDLQIVNGGQTTASLFYVDRDEKQPPQFHDVAVQAKIVVVTPERAQELVPSISRYANSQNKVSEADFFSNSPFHVRLEELSRRLLTPPRPGVNYQTKWFYERTRGQYLNEKSKLSQAEQKKYATQYPRNQLITKTDAAKYLVSWAQKPHLVSSGAQKNFIAFANEVSAKWESSDADFNEAYFRELVAKAILFNSVRSEVSKQDWYQTGYLANIVTYTVAKIASLVPSMGTGAQYDFDAVWARQEVPEATMELAMKIAPRVLRVLTDENRPITNVTEWAKRAECWKTIEAMPLQAPEEFRNDLQSRAVARTKKVSARKLQKLDDGINGQAAVLQVPTHEWVAMQEFAAGRRLLSPTEAGILALVTGARPGVPSEKQSKILLDFKQRVIDNGYEYLT